MPNSELFLGNLLLLVLVIIEILVIKFYLKENLPWRELILNLNSGHILLWIFRGLEVSMYFYTAKYISLNWVEHLPYWGIWLLAFVLWDFFFYWLHRLHHFYSFLWSVHVVHHEGEHFSLSLGIRNSWYSSLTSFPFFIGLALLGIPVEVFVTVSSIHYFIQFYNHNHLVKRSGWLEHVLITPSHHRVHHGMNDPYLDKNFGGTFVFWDKIFGTFQSEIESHPVVFGTSAHSDSLNPVVVNNAPILKLFGFNLPNDFFKSKILICPVWLLTTKSLLLFLLLLYFIYTENILTFETKVTLFSIIFLGTIGIGLLSENKRIGLYLWLFAIMFIPIIYLLFNV
ncbi:MAG: sterol desaturase family protein [Saprospiraceae bacterium]|nr:sterol desaturase family protein [Saprospiraceae bacterium]MBK9631362.1 sterol desaturase family protein [Saprospiraceae bacterium]